MEKIIHKAEQTHTLSKDEITALLRDKISSPLLFAAADHVRQKYVGNEVYLRALIEFSNICKNKCLYCGINATNKLVERYRLNEAEIISVAEKAADAGLKTIVLQSGEDAFFDTAKMCFIIREIKKLGVAVTLSIGERSRADYAAFKQAGADRYLLRIETTDKNLYARLDPDMDWENRRRCLFDLKELGFEVGSGNLVGLPNQSLESLADDILFFKELNLDMAGIGPFIPHPHTPLKDVASQDNLSLALKVMALTRLLLPDINIPATTAMETLDKNGRSLALSSGANVVMPAFTAKVWREKYELYPNKAQTDDFTALKEKILSLGRTIGQNIGSHGEYLKGKRGKDKIDSDFN